MEVSGVTSAPFTITELGAPHANSGTTGVAATPANGGPKS